VARRAVVDISGLATIETVLPEFDQSLRAAGRSPRTIQSYVESCTGFDRYLASTGRTRRLGEIGRSDVDAWVVHLRERFSPATVGVRYRSLQAFFKWCVNSGELAHNPMVGTEPPRVPVVPVDFVTEDELRSLLAVMEVKERTFDDWRDAALVRLFYDTGCRLSEVVGLRLQLREDDDRACGLLDLEQGAVLVLGKGGRWRQATFGVKARAALRRYIAARTTHPLAASDWLWLGSRGKPLTQSGIAQMLRRRCQQAGIRPINPHQFRHARAHDALARGMSEGDAMTFFGWRSREMLARYGAALAEERALEAARRQGAPGDRL